MGSGIADYILNQCPNGLSLVIEMLSDPDTGIAVVERLFAGLLRFLRRPPEKL